MVLNSKERVRPTIAKLLAVFLKQEKGHMSKDEYDTVTFSTGEGNQHLERGKNPKINNVA